MKKKHFFVYILMALLIFTLTASGNAFAAPLDNKSSSDNNGIPILMEDINFRDKPISNNNSNLFKGQKPLQQFDTDESPSMTWNTAPNPSIASMIQEVTEQSVKNYEENLTGIKSVIIGSYSYNIKSRYSKSGTPIKNATQYIYEYLQSLGIAASYNQYYISNGYSNILSRNVIGEIPGSTNPEQVVLIAAHLDDLPSSSTNASGADDNASGSTAVMLAANVMSKYHFEKTIRFAFFTGEEQGLLGSRAYAQKLADEGTNVVAVYNADMIGFDSNNERKLILHTRRTTQSGYQSDAAIAQVMQSVIQNYNLGSQIDLTISNSGETRSDHSSFWNKGYPGIMIIEGNFSPYYHTANDTIYNLSIPFMTSSIRAFIGTAAHLAVPKTQMQTNPVNADKLHNPGRLPEIKAA